MPESHRNINVPIWSVKSPTSVVPIRTLRSTKMLPVDLTTHDLGCKPFWNPFVEAKSAQLRSCTGTDFVALDTNFWPGSLTRLTQKSWFNVQRLQPQMITEPKNFPTILSLSSPYLWQDIMADAAQKIEKDAHKKQSKTNLNSQRKRNPETEAQQVAKKAKKNQELDRLQKLMESKGSGRGGKRITTKPRTPTMRKPKSEPVDMVCKNIRLYPTKSQRKVLNFWFGCARWTYNKCVDLYKTEGRFTSNISFLRRMVVNQGNHKDKDTSWILESPTEIREGALRDFIKAVQSNQAKMKKDPEHTFKMQFKSAKADSDSMVISKKRGHLERELLPKIQCEYGLLNLSWNRDMRLTRKKNGQYYLCIPDTMTPVNENQVPKLNESVLDGVVALDPGVRTFMTCYEANGNITEWCAGDEQRLCRLNHHLDKLRWRINHDTDVRHKARYRMRKAASRIASRMHHLVDDIHRKLAKWLCENHRVIFLPKFEIKDMVKKKTKTKGRRNIPKKTVRALYAWRHYTFRQRLLSKAREFPWVQIYLVNEAYTSKTCTHCGWFNSQLGGAKMFECQQCHRNTPRDIAGARNILLRQLGLLDPKAPEKSGFAA